MVTGWEGRNLAGGFSGTGCAEESETISSGRFRDELGCTVVVGRVLLADCFICSLYSVSKGVGYDLRIVFIVFCLHSTSGHHKNLTLPGFPQADCQIADRGTFSHLA